MGDMFPGASALGDTAAEVLKSSAVDQQNQYYAESRRIQSESRIDRMQNMGVKDMPSQNSDQASRNSPQYGNEKNRPTATEDPQAVEERWIARMAKFAGISQATGVKI